MVAFCKGRYVDGLEIFKVLALGMSRGLTCGAIQYANGNRASKPHMMDGSLRLDAVPYGPVDCSTASLK
jgi:hypothetical protein